MRGRQEIRNLDIRNLGSLALECRGLADPRRQMFAEPDLDCSNGCDERYQRNEPDSQ